MAVAYDATTGSHASGSWNASATSFNWNHVPVGTPSAIIVMVCTMNGITSTNTDKCTGVTYGGQAMTDLGADYEVACTVAELGRVDVYFLASPPSGTQSVVVSRTNTADYMVACAVSVIASGTPSCIGPVKVQSGSATISAQYVDDGSPGTNSLRLAAGFGGYTSPLPVNTTYGNSAYANDLGGNAYSVCYEKTAGQGARYIGFTYGTNDDLAVIHFAVKETVSGGATGPANLKTVNGLAKASVKTINGLAIASIKSVNGLN